MTERFDLTQFFADGTYETVYRELDFKTVGEKFQHYINNVAAQMGITSRVIITDSGDCIVAEWINGRGLLTFPDPDNIDVRKHHPDCPAKDGFGCRCDELGDF